MEGREPSVGRFKAGAKKTAPPGAPGTLAPLSVDTTLLPALLAKFKDEASRLPGVVCLREEVCTTPEEFEIPPPSNVFAIRGSDGALPSKCRRKLARSFPGTLPRGR